MGEGSFASEVPEMPREIMDALGGCEREYVVANPRDFVVELDDGTKVPLNADVRERIVRCRDCRRSFEKRGELWCRGIIGPSIEPDGFCAWGEERED